MFLIDKELKINLIGGKGYKLVYFKENSNLLIPKFKCISSEFFESYQKDKRVIDKIKEELNYFLDKNKKYAVRSSAIDEDSNDCSFAGIHDTFLNVKANDVLDKIFEVYQSGFSDLAINYRKNNNLNTTNIKMSVVVQEMVDADFAGVINTINPLTNNPDEIVISVIKGLGEDLVNGNKDGSTYIINGNNVNINGEDILNKKLINKLIEFVKVIVDKCDRFQDIEFAIKDNLIYFLQTRDITVYKNINPHDRVLFIDNANIIESYYGNTSILTYTFAKDVYRDVYTCTLNAGKVRNKIMESLKPSLAEMIYHYNGRIYYNMNSWYHVNSIFPFKKSTSYMENMMGVKSSTKEFKRVKMNIFDMIKLAILFIYKVIKIDKLSNNFINKFDKVVMPYYGKSINLSNQELKELFNRIENDITKDFAVPIINDCALMIFYGLLKEKVKKNKKIINKDDFISFCISNNGDVESCGSSTNLENIANKIKDNSNLFNDFLTLSVDELYVKYHNKNSYIYDDVVDYIKRFGSRVTDELKMETVTMIEDNKIVYDYLKNIVSTNEVINQKEHKYDVEKIPKGINRLAKLTKKFIKNRERLRLKRTYIYSVVRNIFLCYGKNLYQEGRIDRVEDIFYLTKDELFNCDKDLKIIIETRKQEEFENLQKPYYDRYVFYKNNQILDVKNTANDNMLTGIPSGAGIITSKATIMNSNQDYLEKGNIIVTKRTDPGWISLFPLASGLVVEHGSMLSHSFVVAREMNLPAVVGVSRATELIKNGEVITVDAVKGIVRNESKEVL